MQAAQVRPGHRRAAQVALPEGGPGEPGAPEVRVAEVARRQDEPPAVVELQVAGDPAAVPPQHRAAVVHAGPGDAHETVVQAAPLNGDRLPGRFHRPLRRADGADTGERQARRGEGAEADQEDETGKAAAGKHRGSPGG